MDYSLLHCAGELRKIFSAPDWFCNWLPMDNDSLVLNLQAITHDHRHAVSGQYAVRHPRLPEMTDDEPGAGRVFFDFDDESKLAEAWLNRQPDDSFQPSIACYVGMRSRLEIRQHSRKGLDT